MGEGDLNKITDNAISKIWEDFLVFGSASAGVIGLFILIKGVKIYVDAVIRGYVLHTVYGWSLYLLEAIWSSLTHLLIHLKQPREYVQTGKKNDRLDETEEAKEHDLEGNTPPVPVTRGK